MGWEGVIRMLPVARRSSRVRVSVTSVIGVTAGMGDERASKARADGWGRMVSV